MEVKFGVVHSARELVVDTDSTADAVIGLVEDALTAGIPLLWLQDVGGRRVGIPVSKLAYIEIGEDQRGRRVGFGL